jgi:prolyl-tRNA synthetase
VLVSRVSGVKKQVPLSDLVSEVQAMLEEVHQEMYQRALQFREENFFSVETLDELKGKLEEMRGFALAGWCGSEACEKQVKEESGATSRNIPFKPSETKTTCLVCGDASKHTVVFARAY